MGTASTTTAIDLFAGAGGFSEGATQAGATVLWAANHWPAAVEVHANNHPDTFHMCQDLHQADWAAVPAHDVLLASPCCQGHSRARGKDRTHHDASRSTAWAVISCMEYHQPKAVVIENVPEFRDWRFYQQFISCITDGLGYSVSAQVIDAADCGTPQHRQRLFLVATQGDVPFDLGTPDRPHVPVKGLIQWQTESEALLGLGRWSRVDKPGRSTATLRRVANGRRAFGERFVMPFYGSGSGLTGRSLERPIGTITTRARWAVVDGPLMRMLSVDECRAAMGFPDGYRVPSTPIKLGHHLLGNAVCPPVSRWIMSQLIARA